MNGERNGSLPIRFFVLLPGYIIAYSITVLLHSNFASHFILGNQLSILTEIELTKILRYFGIVLTFMINSFSESEKLRSFTQQYIWLSMWFWWKLFFYWNHFVYLPWRILLAILWVISYNDTEIFLKVSRGNVCTIYFCSRNYQYHAGA